MFSHSLSPCGSPLLGVALPSSLFGEDRSDATNWSIATPAFVWVADLWQQFRSPYCYHCTRKTPSFLEAWPQKIPLSGWWGVPLPRGTCTVDSAPSTPLEAFWAIQAVSVTGNTGEQAFFPCQSCIKKIKNMLFSPWTCWTWFWLSIQRQLMQLFKEKGFDSIIL